LKWRKVELSVWIVRQKMIKQKIFYDKEKTQPVTDFEVDEDGQAIIREGTWYVFGRSIVEAHGASYVYAFDNATVHAFDYATVHAFDYAMGYAVESAEVRYFTTRRKKSWLPIWRFKK
jgi:hypothetical protein